MTAPVCCERTRPIPSSTGRTTGPSHAPSRRVLPGGGEVSIRADGAVVEVDLKGEIDAHDRAALAVVLGDLPLLGRVELVRVDAGQVAFIDVRSLRMLAALRARLRATGGDMVVDGLAGANAAAWALAVSTAAPPAAMQPAG